MLQWIANSTWYTVWAAWLYDVAPDAFLMYRLASLSANAGVMAIVVLVPSDQYPSFVTGLRNDSRAPRDDPYVSQWTPEYMQGVRPRPNIRSVQDLVSACHPWVNRKDQQWRLLLDFVCSGTEVRRTELLQQLDSLHHNRYREAYGDTGLDEDTVLDALADVALVLRYPENVQANDWCSFTVLDAPMPPPVPELTGVLGGFSGILLMYCQEVLNHTMRMEAPGTRLGDNSTADGMREALQRPWSEMEQRPPGPRQRRRTRPAAGKGQPSGPVKGKGTTTYRPTILDPEPFEVSPVDTPYGTSATSDRQMGSEDEPLR
jgi:hypothetical protein